MKKILAIMALALMAFGAKAQTQAAAPEAVAKVNAGCPKSIGEGCTLESVTLGDGAVVFAYNVSDEMFGNLEPMKDILHDTMVAEIMSTPDAAMKQLVTYCVSSGKGIVQRFVSPKGTSFDLRIAPGEMK